MVTFKEKKNPVTKAFAPIKEHMNIQIPGIKDPNIAQKNGTIEILVGSGGSGKSSLLYNQFNDKDFYREKFDNVWLFVPESSFLSAINHPFRDHKKVYHELTAERLREVYDALVSIKAERGEDEEVQYNAIIIDDFADTLKDLEVERELSRLAIKTRHLATCIFITVQSFRYMPKLLRKQVNYFVIFKPKNNAEWDSIAAETFHLTKQQSTDLYNYAFVDPYDYISYDAISGKFCHNNNALEILP